MKKRNLFFSLFASLILLSSCVNSNSKTSSTRNTTTSTKVTQPTIVPTSQTKNPTTTNVLPTTSSNNSTTVMPTINPTTKTTTTANATVSIRPDIDYSNSLFASSDGVGSGTFDSPCSLSSAINALTTTKTLYLLDGVYNMDSPIIFRNSGTADSYYKIEAYGEDAILDFGKDYRVDQTITNEYNKESNKGIVIKADYYSIKGITIRNCGSTGMHIYGNYNIIDDCVFAFNGNTGLNINGNSSNTIEKWPSNNLIKNCTSYGNYDWNRDDGNQGEDADGFGAKLCLGINNVFDGCIAYNNSDDGWDLFTKHKTGKIGAVTIKNCIAFNNGYAFDGTSMKNGNGFKLGGRALEVDHIITNSIAFNNKANGFDDNSNPGTITVTNCTGYNNGARNFATGRFLEENNTYKSTWYEDEDLFGPIENVKKSHNVFDGVLSYKGGTTDSYSGVAQNSYFYDNSGKFVIFDALSDCNSKYKIGTKYIDYLPFKSLEIKLDLYNIHNSFRDKDGSINLGDYLKPIDNITAGARL